MSKTTKPQPFEKSMAELEKIISSLENGEMPLDDAMKAFEIGSKLVANCQTQLNAAEMKIEEISNNTQKPA